MITIAVLPACLLLPFFPSRCRHAERLISQLEGWTTAILRVQLVQLYLMPTSLQNGIYLVTGLTR
jgi:hypothetical protein